MVDGERRISRKGRREEDAKNAVMRALRTGRRRVSRKGRREEDAKDAERGRKGRGEEELHAKDAEMRTQRTQRGGRKGWVDEDFTQRTQRGGRKERGEKTRRRLFTLRERFLSYSNKALNLMTKPWLISRFLPLPTV